MAKINPNNIMTPSLRGGRKTDEAIHITSFMDCHAHIRSLAMTSESGLPRPTCVVSLIDVNLLDFLHKSKIVEGFLGETKPSTAVYINVHEERRRVSTTKSPTRLAYAGSLLWINTNGVSYNLDIIV